MQTRHLLAVAAACALLAGCNTTEANTRSTTGAGFAGKASYYSHAGRTATGARFNPHGLTAAHRTLPFGTKLRVSDPKSGRSVVVTVNDRGPFTGGRVLDLSLGAAQALGMTGRGVMHVRAERL
jgi:rare lipoprotein A